MILPTMKKFDLFEHQVKILWGLLCILALATCPSFVQATENQLHLPLQTTDTNSEVIVQQSTGNEDQPVLASISGEVVFIDEDGFFRLGDFPELLFLNDVRPIRKNSFAIIKGWKLDCLIYDFKIGDPTPPRRVLSTADKASTYGVSLLLIREKLAVYRNN